MISQKQNPSPTRLAELALENGWCAEEVARVLKASVGPTDKDPDQPAPTSVVEVDAKALHEQFERLAPKAR